MKAIILARVSSKEQEDGQSIPAQVHRAQQYVQRKGFELLETFEITESSTRNKRKQFENVLNIIKRSKDPIALVCDCVDRLQRSFRETPILDDLRKKGKLEIHFLRESLILNQDSNSALLSHWDMLVVISSAYVRNLSDNVKRSKDHAVRNGVWVSKAPAGYKNVSSSGEKTLEIDPAWASFIRKIFELYATGSYSLSTLAKEMKEQGWTNSNGKAVTTSQLDRFLDNPFYYGMMRVKGKLYPHKYPPLISESLFNQCQKIKHKANPADTRHGGKVPLLLRGLMTCSDCGCRITGDVKKGKYTYYSCTNGKGVCKKEWVREEELVAPMLDYLERIQLSDDLIEKIVDYLKKSFEAEQEFYKQTHENLRKELDQVQNRISHLVDAHLDGKIDGDIYEQKLNEYKSRQLEITSLMEAHVDADKASLITVKTVLDLAKRAKEIYESSKVEEKRQILNFLFSNLEMKDKKAIITLREPFDKLIAVSDHPMCRKRRDSNPRTLAGLLFSSPRNCLFSQQLPITDSKFLLYGV